ncbi:MAG: LmbE family protein [Candidatus Hydrogenedens sp.]|nr:LmbE family protein [Candidatus Hydrogenedens sp.]
MSKPTVLAIAAHPDDIEIMMAGTLSLLGDAGYELHMLNIANGSGGSMTQSAGAIAARRWEEAQAAAKALGATMHPPLCDDLMVFYNEPLLRRVAAVVREVAPSIILTQPPQDYMEDHMNSCRLAVSAGFVRGVPNFQSDPPRPHVENETRVYHALPWGLCDPLGAPVHSTHYVDVTAKLALKREALACHASQKDWLDATQGLDSYLDTMETVTREVGRRSGRFEAAEGWRRHLNYGYCAAGADPLCEALGDTLVIRTEENLAP